MTHLCSQIFFDCGSGSKQHVSSWVKFFHLRDAVCKVLIFAWQNETKQHKATKANHKKIQQHETTVSNSPFSKAVLCARKAFELSSPELQACERERLVCQLDNLHKQVEILNFLLLLLLLLLLLFFFFFFFRFFNGTLILCLSFVVQKQYGYSIKADQRLGARKDFRFCIPKPVIVVITPTSCLIMIHNSSSFLAVRSLGRLF